MSTNHQLTAASCSSSETPKMIHKKTSVGDILWLDFRPLTFQRREKEEDEVHPPFPRPVKTSRASMKPRCIPWALTLHTLAANNEVSNLGNQYRYLKVTSLL